MSNFNYDCLVCGKEEWERASRMFEHESLSKVCSQKCFDILVPKESRKLPELKQTESVEAHADVIVCHVQYASRDLMKRDILDEKIASRAGDVHEKERIKEAGKCDIFKNIHKSDKEKARIAVEKFLRGEK